MTTELTYMQQAVANGKATLGMLEVDAAINALVLPELAGSEKQAAWATTIRRAELEIVVEELLPYQRKAARRGLDINGELNRIIGEFVANTEAAYWIDGRNGGRRGRVAVATEEIGNVFDRAAGR